MLQILQGYDICDICLTHFHPTNQLEGSLFNARDFKLGQLLVDVEP